MERKTYLIIDDEFMCRHCTETNMRVNFKGLIGFLKRMTGQKITSAILLGTAHMNSPVYGAIRSAGIDTESCEDYPTVFALMAFYIGQWTSNGNSHVFVMTDNPSLAAISSVLSEQHSRLMITTLHFGAGTINDQLTRHTSELDLVKHNICKRIPTSSCNRDTPGILSVYVGGLPSDFTSRNTVGVLFHGFECTEITVFPARRGRQFTGARVTLTTEEEVERAIGQLNGRMVRGKPVVVERYNRPQSSGSGSQTVSEASSDEVPFDDSMFNLDVYE